MIKWSGEDESEEIELENLKRQLNDIELGVERRKQELFEGVCNSTRLFIVGDPKEILRRDILNEIWMELYFSRRYRVERKSIEEFRKRAIERIRLTMGIEITIDIPLLDHPDNDDHWKMARECHSLGTISIDGDVFHE